LATPKALVAMGKKFAIGSPKGIPFCEKIILFEVKPKVLVKI
jgi:hypothetical protein